MNNNKSKANIGVEIPVLVFLCAVPCRGTKPQSGARGARRVEEKVFPLFDCAGVRKEIGSSVQRKYAAVRRMGHAASR